MNIKYFLKSSVLMAIAAITLSSCDSKDDTETQSHEAEYLSMVLANYVDYTVNPTYKNLALHSQQLFDKVCEMRESARSHAVTESQVKEACELWKAARQDYEQSEAFLLGAASKFDIDPHIDTWPLDLDVLNTTLKSTAMINKLDNEDGHANVYAMLGQANVGFHGLEFILFRDGQPRRVSELNGYDSYKDDNLDFTAFSGEYELIYAAAVAGDLRNQCFRMECGWNDAAPADHKSLMDDLEWAYTAEGGNTYGWMFANAGKAGSVYSSVKIAISSILVGDGGAAGIGQEVGDTKIANPAGYSEEPDPDYIESPYSWNSLTDFNNNIQSIENVWYGGTAAKRGNYSLSSFFKQHNAEIAKRVEDAISNAHTQIKAIATDAEGNAWCTKTAACKKATDACHELVDALTEANQFILNLNI